MDDHTSTGTEDLLREVCQSIALLLSGAATRPARLTVRAGAVEVELEWHAVPGLLSVPATAVPDVVAPAPEPESGVFYLRAATVGTFYRSPEPGARPFAAGGDTVQRLQQVGILEAMKMMLPVEIDRPGRIVEFLVEDAAPVEFDTPLVALVPVGDAAG